MGEPTVPAGEALNAALHAFLHGMPDDGRIIIIGHDQIRAGLAAALPLLAEQALRDAYWRLREHASGLRATAVYREARDRALSDRTQAGDALAHRRYRWLEATARGIEDGAGDLAEMLGVLEHEIEKPAARDAEPHVAGQPAQPLLEAIANRESLKEEKRR